jgi:hypothetical protein
MSDQLVRYDGVVIRARVVPASTGGFVGHAEITDADAWNASQTRSYPSWVRPANSELEAQAKLVEFAKRVVDGLARTGDLINFEE